MLEHPDEQPRAGQVGGLWSGQVISSTKTLMHEVLSLRLYNAEDKDRPYTNKVITLWYRSVENPQIYIAWCDLRRKTADRLSSCWERSDTGPLSMFGVVAAFLESSLRRSLYSR